MNQEIIDEITNQDYQKIKESIEASLEKKLAESDCDGIIFGLSGGIDSATVACLCSNVLKNKSLALVMPDSQISPNDETEDALQLVKKLGLEYKLIDINLIHNQYSKILEPNDLALGNLRARIRANILYYYANAKNFLVVGTSDKSEYLIGYFTKFGDGSADILPIVSLYKTQVRRFAKLLNVPDSIIAKKSSPNLWKGHIAEEELGLSYEIIDSVLYCIFNKKFSIDETVTTTEIDKNSVDKIYQLYKKSQHKRITAEKIK